MLINIVYDVDDVLNNLNYVVFESLGMLDNMPKRFNISECEQYTDEEKKAILEMYGKTETFAKTSLNDGAKDICNIEKSGLALVYINSRNFSEEIARIKTNMLLEQIPGLSYHRIEMQIGNGEGKRITENAHIVIEDCITNLFKYPSKAVKILINRSHNQADEYGIIDEEAGIIRVKDLKSAVEMVENIVNEMGQVMTN